MKYHLSKKVGTVLRCLQRGASSFSQVLKTCLFSLLPVILQLLLISVYLLNQYAWYFSAIILTSVVMYVVFTFVTTEWRSRIQRQLNESDNRYTQLATDALINFETVKYFNAEFHESKRYFDSFQDYKKASIRMQSSLAFLNIGQEFCIRVGFFFCLLLVSLEIANGERQVGDFVLMLTFIQQIYSPLNNLGSYYRSIKQSFTDMEGVFDLLSQKEEIRDQPFAKKLLHCKGEIEFKDVRFSYLPEVPVLKGISFKVEPGKTVGIVGKTGSGKSTLMKLLYRFYEVTSGSITIDSHELKDLTKESLRKQIGIVPQDCSLFNESLLYNVTYGGVAFNNEKTTYKETRRMAEWAVQQAQLERLTEKLPESLETKVGERGMKLSGGEKQRVAIARAILKKPKILCFDEATSSLDSSTEEQILGAMKTASRNRTTFMIAHRLATIMHADLILVLKDGKIVERGTHQELISHKGEYWELWKQQLNVIND